VGPPNGNELKLFRANEIVFRWIKLDNNPSYKEKDKFQWLNSLFYFLYKRTGNCETLFPSILNSSSFEQLANDELPIVKNKNIRKQWLVYPRLSIKD